MCRGQPVAIKVLHQNVTLSLTTNKVEELMREVEILRYVVLSLYYCILVFCMVIQPKSKCLTSIILLCNSPTQRHHNNFSKRSQTNLFIYISCLRHPNILTLMGVCYESEKLCIVMEFVRGKPLHEVIRNPKVSISMQQSLYIARGIALGAYIFLYLYLLVLLLLILTLHSNELASLFGSPYYSSRHQA